MQPSTEQALVSVVMATYNGERYLEEQLLSIRNQTYTTLEIIVVDDASTDSTLDILRRHAAQDDRIRIHVNACNQGTASAFEAGFALSSGEFVAISDQDDIWLPGKIEILMQALGDNAGIYTDSRLIDQNGEDMGLTLMQRLCIDRPVSGRDFLSLLHKNCVSGHAMLVRRSVLDMAVPFHRDDCFLYDQQLAIMAMICGGLVYSETAQTCHRIHAHNQVNGLLRGSDGENRCSRKKDRHARYRRIRHQLRKNIRFVLSRLDPKILPNNARHDVHHARSLLEILDRRLATPGYSWPLFFTLIGIRRRLFYFSRKPLISCSRLCRAVSE